MPVEWTNILEKYPTVKNFVLNVEVTSDEMGFVKLGKVEAEMEVEKTKENRLISQSDQNDSKLSNFPENKLEKLVIETSNSKTFNKLFIFFQNTLRRLILTDKHGQQRLKTHFLVL